MLNKKPTETISLYMGMYMYWDIQVHVLIKHQDQLHSKILFVSAIAFLVNPFKD